MSKRKAASESDWRSTIFYWRGTLGTSGSWTGTWVGSAADLPSDDEYAASVNTFKLTLTLPGEGTGDTLDAVAGMTGTFAGSYLLDQGDGLQSFSDLSQNVSFSKIVEDDENGTFVVVVACGNTEFGRFVSAGRLTERDGQLTLLLARRYVRDQDPRAAFADAAAVLSSYSQPFHCNLDPEGELPWRVSAKKNKK